jgi:hypothetical protein
MWRIMSAEEPGSGGPPRSGGHWKVGRDTVLFLVGIGGIINEAFVRTGDPRTELLILFAGMCGLPAFFRVDEKGNKSKDG